MQGYLQNTADISDPHYVFGDAGAGRRKVSRDELMSFVHALLEHARSRPVARITIRNIETDFDFDLSNLGDASAPLPRVLIHNCAMPAFTARFSNLAGVTVSDCAIDCIDLAESSIDFEIKIINQTSAGTSPIRLVNTICRGAIVIDSLATSRSRSGNVSINIFGARAHRVSIANVADGATLYMGSLRAETEVTVAKCVLHPNGGGNAITLENIAVGSSLHVRDSSVIGTVYSTNINVGGILSFKDSEFRVKSGPWLSFNRAVVGGSIQFDAIRATGQVRILSGDIAGNFRISASRLALPDEHKNQNLFDCHRLNILGELRFDRGTVTSGGLRFGSCAMANLLITDCELCARMDGGYVVALMDGKITASAVIKESKLRGHPVLQNCEIGSFSASNLEFWSQDQKAREKIEDDFDLIDLNRSTVRKLVVVVGTLTSECPRIYVDLYDASVGRIDVAADDFYRWNRRSVTWRDMRRNLREQGGWWRLKLILAIPVWAAWQLALKLASDRPDDLGICLFNLERSSYDVLPSSIDDRAFLRMRRAFARYNGIRGRLPTGATFVDFARYLQRLGQADIAERVMLKSRRFHATNEGRPLLRLAYGLFDAMFGYGYSKLRATITLCAWVLIGAIGIQKALDEELLVLDSQVVASTIIPATGSEGMRPGMPVLSPEAGNDIPIPCRGSVDPALFAIDMIIPIHDFGQAKICTLKPVVDVAGNAAAGDPLAWWWIGRYLYTIGGWIIVSLVVLTFTGTLKTRLPE